MKIKSEYLLVRINGIVIGTADKTTVKIKL